MLVAARGDGFRRFAAGAAVAPELPAGIDLADLRRGQSLVVAVVPLAQVLANQRALAESDALAGVAGAQQRAGQDQVVLVAADVVGHRVGLALALGRQRNVGVAGVACR